MPGTRDSERLFSTVSILQLVPSPVLLKQIKIVQRDHCVKVLPHTLTPFVSNDGRIELDREDADGQTLLVWFRTIAASQSGYVQPAVRIERGAKSALDLHRDVLLRPYIAEDAPELNISVPGVTATEPPRTGFQRGLRHLGDIAVIVIRVKHYM